jgi:hypothetical protein
MSQTHTIARGITAAVAAVTVACAGDSRPEPADTPSAAAQDAADHGSMQMDPAVMQRHAAEADSAVADVRQHVQRMRQLSAAQQHERIGEHTTRLAGLLNLMDNHMREMDMGMNMGDDHMGAMMGMSAEEHRQMMAEVQTLRSEAEALQVASAADVARQMPTHLQRLEGLLDMMSRSAAHMHMSRPTP